MNRRGRAVPMVGARATVPDRRTSQDTDAAFTEWVVAHRPQLTRTAYLLCADRDLAEDLVQTCLTRLYLAWPRIAEMEAPQAYARRALVNAHIDLTRRRWWSIERVNARVDHDPEPPDRRDQVAEVDVRDVVVTALGSLPSGQRRVVVLRYLCGLSVRETARELGISEGTVKSQTADALRRLATVLAPAVEGVED